MYLYLSRISIRLPPFCESMDIRRKTKIGNDKITGRKGRGLRVHVIPVARKEESSTLRGRRLQKRWGKQPFVDDTTMVRCIFKWFWGLETLTPFGNAWFNLEDFTKDQNHTLFTNKYGSKSFRSTNCPVTTFSSSRLQI